MSVNLLDCVQFFILGYIYISLLSLVFLYGLLNLDLRRFGGNAGKTLTVRK
jgi:hypothetical protein